MHIRDIRGLLPLLKTAGQTEMSLLKKTREQILWACNVKFRFVDGFVIKSVGSPLAENASGVVVALVGFDRSVVTHDHERLPASYRCMVRLKETSAGMPDERFINLVEQFASKYCDRDLLINPMHLAHSTAYPPPTLLDVRTGKRTEERSKPVARKSRVEKLRCQPLLQDGRFACEVDCWLNFPLPSIIKLMEEKLETGLELLECRRTKLGPWTADGCLDKSVLDSSTAPSMDEFARLFRESRVMHRSLLEKCFTVDAWAELCDARVLNR